METTKTTRPMTQEKKQTAMQQLKDAIQFIIGEMNGELNLYESGYKQCLINIQNDIDLQMLQIEKEQIKESFCEGYREGEYDAIGSFDDTDISIFSNADNYYDETYGK